jgi:hypothetical protein
MNLNKIKNILVVLFLVLVLLILFFLIYSNQQNNKEITNLDDNLRLKTPKENIVLYTEYPTGDGEPIIQYIYSTDQTVLLDTHQGLEEDISMRTPTSQSYLKSVKQISETEVEKEYVGKFYSGTNFHRDNNNDWYYTDVATTTKSAFLLQINPTLLDKTKEVITGTPVFAATDTTYSGAGDGYVHNSDTDWDVAHDALTGDTVYVVVWWFGVGTNKSIIGGNYSIYRGFLPFDTSSLFGTLDIISASLFVNTSVTTMNTDTNHFITVVQTTQASNTTLTTADYDTCGAVDNPTEGIDVGDRQVNTDFSVDAYTEIPLNSTGLSWISTSGYTKLGLRMGYDALDVTDDTVFNNIQFYTSEQAGTDKDPYLEIIYAVPTRLKIDGGKVKIDGGKVKID